MFSEKNFDNNIKNINDCYNTYNKSHNNYFKLFENGNAKKIDYNTLSDYQKNF